jgi:ribosomal-protein-alanine N-acetyltransferase
VTLAAPRPATVEDVAGVVALDRQLFGPDAWTDGQVAEELTGPHRSAWVAVSGSAVVGYVMTMTVGDVSDLQRIAVRPDHRRAGLAHTLLALAIERATADGAARMLLEVSAANAGALAFYDAEGFGEIDRRRRYYRDGSDAVVMARDTGRPLHG